MKDKKDTISKIIFLITFTLVLSYSAVSYSRQKVDIEPSIKQLPYSPADGSSVEVNPPPFIWVPVDDNSTFTLQISKDRYFNSDVITIKGIGYSTYALEKPLESGEWYWRYGIESDEIVYSRARKFTVPYNTKVWSIPNIKQILNSVPQNHPRLFILADEVESYRYRAKYGDLKEICETLIKECEKHISEEIVAEPPYVRGTGPERGKNYQRIFRSTRPPMDLMEQCGLAYLLTGDKKFGEEAKRRILHFFSWNPNGSTAYKNNDEPAMWVMMRGIRGYDWTYDFFTPLEREKVEKIMKIRAAQFFEHLRYKRKYHTDPYESHANRTLGFLGEACLCFAHEWAEAEDWLKYVMTMYWNIFPAWGKRDGGWHEGPSYWSYYMSFALHFILPLKKATGIDLMEKGFFHNTPYYKLYTNPSYAKISPFGDGENAPPRITMGQLMYQFSTLLEDGYIRWYADFMNSGSGSDIMGVVLKDDKIKSKSPSELPQSRYFPGVGLVSIHSDFGNAAHDVHFLIHSDPYGNISHAHPDENAFTIEAFGEALAIASGYYPWYGSDHHKNWQWETKSSNCITIDGGIGQVKRDAKSKGKIVRFETRDTYDYVLADASEAYQGLLKKFLRHVVHIRPGFFIIFDEVEAPKPVTFEWWLHSFSKMRINEDNSSVLITQGNARLEVDFLRPEKLDLFQFRGFPDPPEHGEIDQWHFTASTSSKTMSSKFITLLVPYKENNKPEISVEHLIEKSDEVCMELNINGVKRFVGFLPEVMVK